MPQDHSQMSSLPAMVALRLARDWSQAEVAEKLNVSQPVISYLENGWNNRNPDFRQSLEEVFGFPFDDLMGTYETLVLKYPERFQGVSLEPETD